MLKEYWNGVQWEEVDEEWCKGISRFKEIETLWDMGYAGLKVVYKNGAIVWYSNIHGTWGSPTVFR